MEYTLPETNLLQIKQAEGEENQATFILEPLSPGYGVTIGNSLRRVLLSSLSGAAISSVRIDGVTHEFSTIPGVKEDVVELILNLKGLRIKLNGDEPTTIILEAKKSGEITAKDFKTNPLVEIVDPDFHIATLDKNGKLFLEAYIERGRGYIPTEMKKEQKMPLGTVAIDSIFTPVKKVRYDVENTRVGRMTNFDKLTLEITTDGTISPVEAMEQSARVLVEHFGLIADLRTERPKEEGQLVLTEAEDEIEPEVKEVKAAKKPTIKKATAKPAVKKPAAKKTTTTKKTAAKK